MKNDVAKIGLFGGTFDPIHNGHLQLADWTKRKLSLNRIIFIPTAIPPHKQHSISANPDHRFQMVKLAIENWHNFDICDVEFKKTGISYTIDTIYYFQKLYNLNRDNLFLIVGADSLVDLPNWKDPDKILDNCRMVVLQRSEIDLHKVPHETKQQTIILSSPLIDISATKIRNRIKTCKSITNLVPVRVEQYIYEHHLYR